jgi:translation initiation factor 3 subunit G
VKERIHKGVLARKSWRKFGKCAGLGPGAEEGVTTVGPEETLELKLGAKRLEEDPLARLKQSGTAIACSNCGETGHWSVKCPRRSAIVVVPKPIPNEDPQPLRGPEANQIRIDNLDERTTRDDIMRLCRPFGETTRIVVPRAWNTELCRGFAFVSFARREDAKSAIQTLHGYGYAQLILSVRWADN